MRDRSPGYERPISLSLSFFKNYVLILTEDMFLLIRERGREREKERGKH